MKVARQTKISIGDVTAFARLNDTNTADQIWRALPLKARAKTWGDEIYFSIPVKVDLEDGVEMVSDGALAYWPPGSAFCIFFGPTPMSVGTEIRPASAVNVFGQVVGDPEVFNCEDWGCRHHRKGPGLILRRRIPH